ncbi:hypothetical protein D3C76_1568700 [compost metagenome]
MQGKIVKFMITVKILEVDRHALARLDSCNRLILLTEYPAARSNLIDRMILAYF